MSSASSLHEPPPRQHDSGSRRESSRASSSGPIDGHPQPRIQHRPPAHGRFPAHGRSPERRRSRALFAAITLCFIVLVSACGADGGDETESTQDLLEELEGRPLSPAEVAERNEVAELLCGLDDDVLTAVWDELRPSDFEFQDIVFTSTCPDRLPVYAAHTGRFVVEDDPEG